MAKIAYSKLGLKIDDSVEIIEWNEQNIEVKKYLPIQKKMEIMNKIISVTLQADDKHFNIPQVLVNLGMEMIYNYTNISFTEKQKEDINKLYDYFVSSTLLGQILAVCEREYTTLQTWIFDILTKIYEQQNSARGILELVTNNYNSLNFDIEELQKKLVQNPEELDFLKDVLTNLG